MNYFHLNCFNCQVWYATDERDHRLNLSTTSYENRGRAICEKHRSRDDSNKSSFCESHDQPNESIVSPLDLSKDKPLFNGKTIAEHAGVQLKNGSELGGSPSDETGTDKAEADTLAPLDLSKSFKGPEKPNSKKVTEKPTDKQIPGKPHKKPEVRHSIYRCMYCPYVVNHKNSMTKHTLAMHSNGQKKAQCPKCGKLSKHKYSLAIHMNYCGKEARFCCTYCSYQTHKRDHLHRHVNKHVKKMKAKERLMLKISESNVVYSPVPIQIINQSTSANAKYIEEAPKVNVKECPCCGIAFKYWGVMQRHYKSCSVNCIQCKRCPYKAKDSKMLEIHVTTAHPNVAF